MSRRRHRERETFPMPAADEFISGYPLALRFPQSLRRAVEIAASERSTSVAGFLEQILLEKLVRLGLIETRRATDEDD
jgi:hypothetical protein